MDALSGSPAALAGEPEVIDLNADVGESFGRWQLGDDEALLPHLSSANVACGFHAGDPATLRRTVARAAALSVTVGAQVGYRDLAGFGRRFIDVAPDDLRADVLYQLGALEGLARASGTRVAYLKPHGALYHALRSDRGQAEAVVQAVLDFGGLPVLGFPGAVVLDLATEAGLPVVAEGFADRAYRSDGTLVPRTEPGALLTDPDAVAAQAAALASDGAVGSLCVHGDSPDAPALAAAVRRGLESAGMRIAAFA